MHHPRYVHLALGLGALLVSAYVAPASAQILAASFFLMFLASFIGRRTTRPSRTTS